MTPMAYLSRCRIRHARELLDDDRRRDHVGRAERSASRTSRTSRGRSIARSASRRGRTGGGTPRNLPEWTTTSRRLTRPPSDPPQNGRVVDTPAADDPVVAPDDALRTCWSATRGVEGSGCASGEPSRPSSRSRGRSLVIWFPSLTASRDCVPRAWPGRRRRAAHRIASEGERRALAAGRRPCAVTRSPTEFTLTRGGRPGRAAAASARADAPPRTLTPACRIGCLRRRLLPEQWPEEVWAEDVALMREAGVNLVAWASSRGPHRARRRAASSSTGWTGISTCCTAQGIAREPRDAHRLAARLAGAGRTRRSCPRRRRA